VDSEDEIWGMEPSPFHRKFPNQIAHLGDGTRINGENPSPLSGKWNPLSKISGIFQEILN
jgi:hypothetical protein